MTKWLGPSLYLVHGSFVKRKQFGHKSRVVAHHFLNMLSDLLAAFKLYIYWRDWCGNFSFNLLLFIIYYRLFGIHNRESSEGSYAVIPILAVTTATVMVVGILRIWADKRSPGD